MQWKDPPASPVELPPHMHPHREPPGLDDMERFLADVFLRRYATYCVRRKRFAQAQGAATLWRELGSEC